MYFVLQIMTFYSYSRITVSAIKAKFDSIFASNHDAIFRHACEYEKGQEAIKVSMVLKPI